MKNLNFIAIILAFIVAGVFTSCEQEYDGPDPTITEPEVPTNTELPPTEPAVEPVNASFRGLVVDENNTPLAGAVLQIGTSTTTSNEYGVFVMNNVSADKTGDRIAATYTGYFDAFKRVYPQEGGTSEVTLKMAPLGTPKTFSNAAGAILDFGSLSATFPADGIVDVNGSIYSGDVNVYFTYIDPTTDDAIARTPGDLTGIDESGNAFALESYGMIGVELRDASGNELFVSDDDKVALTIDIPATLTASAPASIPMWHFDEAEGTWVEEGVSQKQGNTYVTEVGHFSYWNWDAKVERVDGEVVFCFKDQNGNTLSNTSIAARYGSNDVWSTAVTDTDGCVTIINFPKDRVVTFYGVQFTESFSRCKITEETNAGPISSGGTTTNVTLNLISQDNYEFELLNCDNELVEEGYIIFNNRPYFAEDGIVNISQCILGGNDFEYLAIDVDGGFTEEGTIVSGDLETTQSLDVCESQVDCQVEIKSSVGDQFKCFNYASLRAVYNYATVNTTYEWSTPNASGSYIWTNQEGIYTVTVTDNDLGCTATASFEIGGEGTCTPVNLGEYVLNCDTTQVTLSVPDEYINIQDGSEVFWGWDTAGLDASQDYFLVESITVNNPNTYTVTVTEFIFDQDSTISNNEVFEYTVVDGSDVPIVTIIEDKAAESEITFLAASAVSQQGFDYSYSYLWDDSTPFDTRAVSAPGTYTVTVTNEETGCVQVESITVLP